MSMVVDVPEQLAEELLADNLAAVPVRHRGDPALLNWVVTYAGITANVTSIAVALPTLAELARRIVRHGRRTEPVASRASLAIRLISPSGETEEIVISQIDETRAVALVEEALRKRSDPSSDN